MRVLARPFLLLALATAACGDGASNGRRSATPTPPTPTPAPTAPMPTPSPTAPTEEIVAFEGPIVVLNRHADGHPRQIGIFAEPSEGTVWTVDGREPIYFWDGPLGRELVSQVGRDVRVRGVLHRGFDGQATLFLRSYDLDGEIVEATPVAPVAHREEVEGTVVVVDRFEDGHPRALGILPEPSDAPVALAETNKSRELRYRVGRTVRVWGERTGEGGAGFVVGGYEELDANPRVQSGDGFRLSFLAGGEDENGRFMGGVEVDALEVFDGRIFAGVSHRRNTDEDSVDPPAPGAPILVLDRPAGRWRVDFLVPPEEAGPGPRMVSLKRVSFTTDGDGRPLEPPVELLAAVSGNGELYLRTPGEPPHWVAAGLADVVRDQLDRPNARPDARSVVTHVDSVTGVAHLFAGAYSSGRRGSGGGVYRATYDPTRPGLLAWAESPEFPYTATRGQPWRVMGITEADGRVYASIGTRLLRREDGPEPRWTEVFRDERPAGLDSLREATEVRDADGRPSIFFGIEGPSSRVVRVDPAAGDEATVDVDPIDSYGPAVYGITAYNGPAARRRSGRADAVIAGLELLRPRGVVGSEPDGLDLGRWYEWTDGLVLWRESADDWRLTRIVDRTLEVHPPVVGPRTILAHSPFAGEEDVVYIGGFDHNGHLFHDTAWIFKVHVDDLRAARGPGAPLAPTPRRAP